MSTQAPTPPPAQSLSARLKALTRNKPLMIGTAAAVALGAYSFVKKRKAAGGGGSSETSATTGGTVGNPAYLNSVGTDVASQLGQFGGSLQTSLDEYAKNLNDTLEALKKAPATDTPGNQSNGPTWINIYGGDNVVSFIKTLNEAGVNIDYGTLVRLNPDLPKWIKWGPDRQHDTFGFNTALRLK